MTNTHYGALERAITDYAWFLAYMRELAAEYGLEDPVEHIEKVATLEPEEVAELAQKYHGISNFYTELAASAKRQSQRLDDVWKSEAAREFDEFFEALHLYVSGDDRSLSDLARATATQMSDTAVLLLEWQETIARTIEEHAKEWEGFLDELYKSALDVLSIDPLAVAGKAAKVFVMAVIGINDSYERGATEGTEMAGAKQTYYPLNSEHLRANFFARSPVTDIPTKA